VCRQKRRTKISEKQTFCWVGPCEGDQVQQYQIINVERKSNQVAVKIVLFDLRNTGKKQSFQLPLLCEETRD